jgi:DHA2 family methylenomycin A resistance protein-like MFS transporter
MISRQRTLTLVVICVGMFLVLLDVTVVNVALPSLRADLGAGVGSLQWIVDGYAVALAALMLPCGDLGDRHGHKRVVLSGLAAFGAANAVGAAMNLGTLGTLFVLTLFLQDVEGRSALGAGLAILPAFALLSVVAPLSGRVVGRIGPRAPMVVVLLVAAGGLALLADDALLAASVLWGLGLGLLTPAVVAAAMGAVPADRAGLAAAVNNTVRQAGGAIGIAASGAVAGSPARAGFAHGFHAVALGAAALYVAAAALAWAAVPSRERTPARRVASSSASG